jgi:3-hydroxyisobutyrate dehydrogenase
MLERSFDPAFKLALAAKDARLATGMAEGAGLDLPLLRAVAERLTAAAGDHGEEDLSAVYLLSAPQQ